MAVIQNTKDLRVRRRQPDAAVNLVGTTLLVAMMVAGAVAALVMIDRALTPLTVSLQRVNDEMELRHAAVSRGEVAQQ